MNEPKLQYMTLPVTLTSLNCPKSVTVSTPKSGDVKFNVKFRDSVLFAICRWSHEPGICVGLPVFPNIPTEQIHELLKERLHERYVATGAQWPGEAPVTGKN